MTPPATHVACEFHELTSESTLSIISAIVDQMCAHADVEARLLEAIEIPLVEAIDALAEHNALPTSVTVSVDPGPSLTLDLVIPELQEVVSESILFGSALPLISAFFDHAVRLAPNSLTLSGLLA